MIKFSLKCSADHSFDSWFQSAEAYDKLAAAEMVSCAVCGTVEVSKSLMAPKVRSSRKGALSVPASDKERALARMRREVEENSDYVGLNFATEARQIHDGEAPARAIYGEAKLEEAKALIEDGVPVMPLPFRPARKTN